MPATRFPRPFVASTTYPRVGFLAALLLVGLSFSGCSLGPMPVLTADRCPGFRDLLPDRHRHAVARGTSLQYRCRFPTPNQLAGQSGLPPVSAPPPGFQGARLARPDTLIEIENAIFQFDSDLLTAQSEANLQLAARELQDYSGLRVRILGYADSTGPEMYNQRLSERRAMTARSFLIEAGVSPSRIEAMAGGETQPLASNSSSSGRAQNRRVEISVR